ncbi:hypothetical protein GCM10022221_59920 [Actinocorallia aurea]
MPDVQFTVPSAFVLGPALAVFAVFAVFRAVRRAPGWTPPQTLTRCAAALYAAAVLDLTVFPITATYGEYANQTPWYDLVNFIPVLTADLTFVPNVIMLVPFGFLLPLFLTRPLSAGRAAAFGCAVSLGIEATQLLSYLAFNSGRSVDVNDLLANTLGAVLGLVAFRLAARTAAAPLLDRAAPSTA